MPTILAIDTTGSVCAAAIAADGRVSILASDADRRAAQDILPLVQRLLQQEGITLSELQGIAVVNGPGSFTGMRIGVAVAQALGMTSGRPVVPVSSLAVMAMSATIEYAAPDRWLTALPARNGEYYLAAYRRNEETGVVVEIPEQVSQPREILSGDESRLDPGSTGIVSSDTASLEELTRLVGGEGRKTLCLERLPLSSVCRLAALVLATETFDGSLMALPNYVKEQMDYS